MFSPRCMVKVPALNMSNLMYSADTEHGEQPPRERLHQVFGNKSAVAATRWHYKQMQLRMERTTSKMQIL